MSCCSACTPAPCRGDCCEGVRLSTPRELGNRPGLDRLEHRVGTHATFLSSLQARLSDRLPALRTRELDDPTMALLDAASVVGDVLTFYSERIVNEGYLRTATERFSVAELARLVGYRPRPGVAASSYLAFTLDPGYAGTVPLGTRAQSLPAPGERPQAFETVADLEARAEWNALRPRLERPQVLAELVALQPPWRVYLRGTATGLRPNDATLVLRRGSVDRLLRVRRVDSDPRSDMTVVEVEPWQVDRSLVSLPAPRDRVAAVRTVLRDVLDITKHGLQPGPAVDRVRDLLLPLAERLDEPEPPATVLRELEAVLPTLDHGRAEADRRRWRRVAHWLEHARDDLDEALYAANTGTTAPRVTRSSSAFAELPAVADQLAKPASRPPIDPTRLHRDLAATYAATSDALPRLLAAVRPDLGRVLYDAWADRPLTKPSDERFDAMRLRARLFGHNALHRRSERMMMLFAQPWDVDEFDIAILVDGQRVDLTLRSVDGAIEKDFPEIDDNVRVAVSMEERPFAVTVTLRRRQVVVSVQEFMRAAVEGCDPDSVTFQPDEFEVRLGDDLPWMVVTGTIAGDPPLNEEPLRLSLDGSFPQVLPGSLVVIDRGRSTKGAPVLVARVQEVAEIGRSDYGLSGISTLLHIDQPWFDPKEDPTFALLRGTTVYAQNEPLELASLPIVAPVCDDRIELDGLYPGLEPGRWLVVAGERTDVPGVTGLAASELAMLAGVEQVVRADLPDDTAHTVLQLANSLAYCYRRDSMIVHANVAPATHGETRTEVLGSGDAAVSSQRFELAHTPLTHVPAITASGVESTLQVRVDHVRWHEAPTLVTSGPADRVYAVDEEPNRPGLVLFGDGIRGARLPTGVENVRARYRSGLGRAGNLGVGRISQLATRPLGVKAVVNPVAATGGADADDADAIRTNAPVGVTALDRLVSVRDHEDFARTFAGIGKAAATRLSDGRRQVVLVTVAGVDDIPIEPTSALFTALEQAFGRFGDPRLPVQLAVRQRLVTILSARVAVHPDHEWTTVEPTLRGAVTRGFGFARRELGQDLVLSQVTAAMQQLPGVAYIDVDAFAAVDEDVLLAAPGGDGLAALLTLNPRVRSLPARVDPDGQPGDRLRPAQLAYLDARVPDTLLLTELQP